MKKRFGLYNEIYWRIFLDKEETLEGGAENVPVDTMEEAFADGAFLLVNEKGEHKTLTLHSDLFDVHYGKEFPVMEHRLRQMLAIHGGL